MNKIKLLYSEEHINCHLYSNDKNQHIRYIHSEEDEIIYKYPPHGICFVLVLKGRCTLSYGGHVNQVLKKNDMLCIPANVTIILNTEKGCEVFAFNMQSKLNFCDSFPIENMYASMPDAKKHFLNDRCKILKMNQRITKFLDLLREAMNDQLKCVYFLTLKQQELLYYLRAYYSKEDLLAFFAPIGSSDTEFSEVIYENAEKIKTIEDVMNLTRYSASGVKKKYLKVFGMTFSEWLDRERSKRVYHAINCSNKTFKEIAYEQGFSSSSHLNAFCKKVFEMPPKDIRKKVRDVNTKFLQ